MSLSTDNTQALVEKQRKLERQRRIRNTIVMVLVLGALAVKLVLSVARMINAA